MPASEQKQKVTTWLYQQLAWPRHDDSSYPTIKRGLSYHELNQLVTRYNKANSWNRFWLRRQHPIKDLTTLNDYLQSTSTLQANLSRATKLAQQVGYGETLWRLDRQTVTAFAGTLAAQAALPRRKQLWRWLRSRLIKSDSLLLLKEHVVKERLFNHASQVSEEEYEFLANRSQAGATAVKTFREEAAKPPWSGLTGLLNYWQQRLVTFGKQRYHWWRKQTNDERLAELKTSGELDTLANSRQAGETVKHQKLIDYHLAKEWVAKVKQNPGAHANDALLRQLLLLQSDTGNYPAIAKAITELPWTANKDTDLILQAALLLKEWQAIDKVDFTQPAVAIVASQIQQFCFACYTNPTVNTNVYKPLWEAVKAKIAPPDVPANLLSPATNSPSATTAPPPIDPTTQAYWESLATLAKLQLAFQLLIKKLADCVNAGVNQTTVDKTATKAQIAKLIEAFKQQHQVNIKAGTQAARLLYSSSAAADCWAQQWLLAGKAPDVTTLFPNTPLSTASLFDIDTAPAKPLTKQQQFLLTFINEAIVAESLTADSRAVLQRRLADELSQIDKATLPKQPKRKQKSADTDSSDQRYTVQLKTIFQAQLALLQQFQQENLSAAWCVRQMAAQRDSFLLSLNAATCSERHKTQLALSAKALSASLQACVEKSYKLEPSQPQPKQPPTAEPGPASLAIIDSNDLPGFKQWLLAQWKNPSQEMPLLASLTKTFMMNWLVNQTPKDLLADLPRIIKGRRIRQLGDNQLQNDLLEKHRFLIALAPQVEALHLKLAGYAHSFFKGTIHATKRQYLLEMYGCANQFKRELQVRDAAVRELIYEATDLLVCQARVWLEKRLPLPDELVSRLEKEKAKESKESKEPLSPVLALTREEMLVEDNFNFAVGLETRYEQLFIREAKFRAKLMKEIIPQHQKPDLNAWAQAVLDDPWVIAEAKAWKKEIQQCFRLYATDKAHNPVRQRIVEIFYPKFITLNKEWEAFIRQAANEGAAASDATQAIGSPELVKLLRLCRDNQTIYQEVMLGHEEEAVSFEKNLAASIERSETTFKDMQRAERLEAKIKELEEQASSEKQKDPTPSAQKPASPTSAASYQPGFFPAEAEGTAATEGVVKKETPTQPVEATVEAAGTTPESSSP